MTCITKVLVRVLRNYTLLYKTLLHIAKGAYYRPHVRPPYVCLFLRLLVRLSTRINTAFTGWISVDLCIVEFY
jgi:hypothetical protein